MAAEKFWSDSALEPKRQHRWYLYVGSGGSINLPTYLVKRVDKPKFMVNTVQHSYFGHKFYYPGNVEWQQISFTLVDPIDPDTSSELYTALLSSGYGQPSVQAVSTVSKDLATKALGGQIRLDQLNADNGVIDTFTLHNPWITNVDFGSLAYESDAMIEISVTLRYDYAFFEKGPG